MVKIGTRDEYYKKTGFKVYGEEDCPLCNALKNERENIIWEGKHWFLIHNIYPYSGTQMHIMAVPIRHIKFSTDLNDDEFLELKIVHKTIKDFFGDENYFSCTRETNTHRSIEHLHIHFIPGKLQGKYIRKMLQHQGFPIVEDMKLDF